MKIYIAAAESQENWWILGVFSTKIEAELCAQDYRNTGRFGASVYEHEIKKYSKNR